MSKEGDEDMDMGKGSGSGAGEGSGSGDAGDAAVRAAITATAGGTRAPGLAGFELALVPCAVDGKVIRCGNGSVYMVLRTLRNCIYGKVRAASVCKLHDDGLYRQTETIVALKIMSKELIRRKITAAGVSVSENPEHELRIMQYLVTHGSNGNILRLVEAIHNAEYLIAVLEYASGGELYDAVTQTATRRFDEATSLYFFKHLINGVAFMHQHSIAHRDLSLENMLIAHGNVGKVIDFGLGIEMPRTALGRYALLPPCGRVGKIFYMAPEILAGNVPYWGHLVDMWSCGVMLFIMLTGAPPFKYASFKLDDRFRLVKKEGIAALLGAWGMTDWMSASVIDLLHRLLQPEPLKRLTVFEVLQHPWMGGAGLPAVHDPLAANSASDDDEAAARAAKAAGEGAGGKVEEEEDEDDEDEDLDMELSDDEVNPT